MLSLDAAGAAWNHEHNARAVLAWNIAALSRTKRLPKVETLLVRERRKKQTWQEQSRLMEQWYADLQRRKALREQ